MPNKLPSAVATLDLYTLYTFYNSPEHLDYERKTIERIALETRWEKQIIPEYVSMIGSSWFSSYGVSYIPESDVFKMKRIDTGLLDFNNTLKWFIGFFHPKADRLAIIPEDNYRMEEARKLGDIVNEDADSFSVKVNNKVVLVYKMLTFKFVFDNWDTY